MVFTPTVLSYTSFFENPSPPAIPGERDFDAYRSKLDLGSVFSTPIKSLFEVLDSDDKVSTVIGLRSEKWRSEE